VDFAEAIDLMSLATLFLKARMAGGPDGSNAMCGASS